MTECSSYDQRSRVCRDGFFQTHQCWGSGACHACGKPSDALPNCMREDLPAHWLDEAGRPLFRRDRDI